METGFRLMGSRNTGYFYLYPLYIRGHVGVPVSVLLLISPLRGFDPHYSLWMK